MQQGDGDDGDSNGGHASAAPTPGDGWFEVPHFDDEDFDQKAGPLFDRLGRPKDPKGYTFVDPEDFQFTDSDREYRESFKPVAHRLGLTARQAKGLADWQVSVAKLARDAEKAKRDDGGKRARAELQKEWGSAFDTR